MNKCLTGWMFRFPGHCVSDGVKKDPTVNLNLSTLFPLFTNEISEDNEVKPSVYQQEVGLSLENRLKQVKYISKYHDYFNSSYGGDFSDCFDVSPNILIFQNWEVDKQYSGTINIRNMTKKVKYISVSVEKLDIFTVSPVQVRKMSSLSNLTYKVKFIPVQTVDYTMQIIFHSDSSFYKYEIIAIAPRPIINFPDVIDLDKTLINLENLKPFSLINKGSAVGMASIQLLCKDMHVKPQYLLMNPEEKIEIEIKFHPSILGPVEEKMCIEYSTGEKLSVKIQALVVSGNIFLSEEELEITETYMGLTEIRSLVLYNKTEYSINYSWVDCLGNAEQVVNSCKYVEQEKVAEEVEKRGVEFVRKEKVSEFSYNENIHELEFGIINEQMDISDSECFYNLYYWHDCFTIIPMNGTVMGNCSETFLISFRPNIVGKIKSTMYLEVEGLENNLSVKISGTSLGPNIYLNLDTLDIDRVYINNVEHYQIFAQNIGLIKGTLCFLPMHTQYDYQRVTCEPKEFLLLPNDVHIINMSVLSEAQGPFVIELKFLIIESGRTIKCILKGTAVQPTIRFDVDHIDFGIVPMGVCLNKCFTITNCSSINVKISIHIPDDGFEATITMDQFIESDLAYLPKYPKEFEIEPPFVLIPADSSVQIQVFLVANVAKSFHSNLILLMWMHSNEELRIPLMFTAIIPTLSCRPRQIDFPYCFMGIEYEQKITLFNDESVQVGYCLLEYENVENSTKCSVKEKKAGVIGPYESEDVILILSTRSSGIQQFSVTLYIFGNDFLTSLCDVTMKGNGPVLETKEINMVWNPVIIFNPSPKTFTIFNHSPISAEFCIAIKKHPELWFISDCKGTLHSKDEISIDLFPNPVDEGHFKDELIIHVKDSRAIGITLDVYASGTSISFSPTLFPKIYLGVDFRNNNNRYEIRVKNIGRKYHVIMFSLDGSLTLRKQRIEGEIQGKYFQFDSPKFSLSRGEEKTVFINYKSPNLGYIEETFYCYARVEGKCKMDLLGSTVIGANFSEPVLDFDLSLFEFEVIAGWYDLKPIIRPFTLHVNWKTPLRMLMSVPSPFGIYLQNEVLYEETFITDIDNPVCTDIYFNPLYEKGYYSRSCTKTVTFNFLDYNFKKCYPIHADVYFSGVSISCTSVDFGCIEPGKTSYNELVIENSTPVNIYYRWYWIHAKCMSLERYWYEMSLILQNEDTSVPFNIYFERTRDARKALKSIENMRFFTYQEFENEVKQRGLTACSLGTNTSEDVCSVEVLQDEYAYCLEISPFIGDLDQKSCKKITIAFTPTHQMFVEAIAVCVIKGSHFQELIIQGSCSSVHFEVIPSVINLGFTIENHPAPRNVADKKFPCCELCKSIFIIKNDCLKQLNYKVHATKVSSSHIIEDILEESHILVEEDSGSVKPYSSNQHEFALWFNTIGEINIELILEVGLIFTKIQIVAYCCPNQILISLPRNYIFQVEEYLVLSSIREPWFCIPDFTTETDELGWEKIFIPEGLISTQDMLAGMERYILHRNLISSPRLLQNHFLSKKPISIKGFDVPGYSVDFGIVLLGTKAEYKMRLFNYFPKEVFLKIIKNKDVSLPKQLTFQDNSSIWILPPMGTEEFSISFSAPCVFDDSDANLSYSFGLEISCGPTIPISVSAIFTIPCLILPKFVDFGIVKCNQMKIINIPIKNIGITPCEWVAFIHNLKEGNESRTEALKSSIKNPFSMRYPYGYTDSQTSDYIPLYFEPMKSGNYDMTLEFVVNMNPERFIIPLKGIGMKPKLNISNVNFGYASPYCKPIIQPLEITNPCPFPIEVFFLGYDGEIAVEENIFKAITRYYKKDVYVPYSYYDSHMTYKIHQMYERLCKQAVTFMEYSRKPEKTESISSLFSRKNTKKSLFKKRSSTRKGVKRIQIVIKISRNKISHRRSRIINTREKPKHIMSQNRYKSKISLKKSSSFKLLTQNSYMDLEKPQEVILDDYLKFLEEQPVSAPSNLAIDEKSVLCDSEQAKESTLIVVLGAPETGYEEWGAKFGKAIGFEAISLDEMIFQELGDSYSPAAAKSRATIRKMYFEETGNDLPTADDEVKCPEDEYLKFRSMIEELAHKNEDYSLSQSKASGGHTNGDSSYGLGLSQKIMPFNLPFEDLEELIRNSIFRISRGKKSILIERMEGIFFKDITIALIILIKNFTDVMNFHIIVLHALPMWYLKSVKDSEMKIDENLNHILEYMALLNGVEHSEIIKNISELTKRLYYCNKMLSSCVKESVENPLFEILKKQDKRSKKKLRKKERASAVDYENSFIGLSSLNPNLSMRRAMKKHCMDIYQCNHPAIKWIRNFIGDSEFNSLLYGFMKFASWFPAIKTLWAEMMSDGVLTEISIKQYENLKLNYNLLSTYKKAKATTVKNDYPDLSLWVLSTEDLKFEKFIPYLSSRKEVFDIQSSKQAEIKEVTVDFVTPSSKRYFRLSHPKSNQQYGKLKNFVIYNEINEEVLLQKQLVKKKMSNLYARQYLLPGETTSWMVVYSPITCQSVCDILSIGVGGFDDCYKVKLSAVCDIPEVSVEFSDIKLDFSINSTNFKINSGYSIEESHYYFSPIFVSRLDKTKVQRQEASFNIRNVSGISVKVVSDFIDQQGVFEVEPKEVEIKPKETVIMKIFSSLVRTGVFRNSLVLLVENNPVPMILKVSSLAKHPKVKFHPQTLKFKKAILYQEVNTSFTITNNSFKEVYWEIANVNLLAPVIRCDITSGILDIFESGKVSIFFRPEISQDQKQLIIQISDVDKKDWLMCKEYTLCLSATDVEVHINTLSGTENHLKLGDIKVYHSYIHHITLSKVDKKTVYYKARIATNEYREKLFSKEYNLSKFINITSAATGFIKGKSETHLTVKVYCTEEVHLEKIEVIFIEIYSPYDVQLQIADIPLFMSFKSHCPRYIVTPEDFLDFGKVEVGTEKCLFLTIKNNGYFEFGFYITEFPVKSSIITSKSEVSIYSSSSEMCTKADLSLLPFKVSKASGTILSGKEEIILITCRPNSTQKSLRTILLTISETPEDSNQLISFSCIGIIPVLNFCIESVFRELKIVERRQELSNFHHNGYYYSAFIKTENVLCFENVVLYQTVNVDLYIENMSQLSSNVYIITNGNGFSVKPNNLYIEPYLVKNVTLTYSPQVLGVHKGEVTIKLNLITVIENSEFTFLVQGNSELPIVRAYKYDSETTEETLSINIGIANNLEPANCLLKIRNDGNITAETIVDIMNVKKARASLKLLDFENLSECEKSIKIVIHPKDTVIMKCSVFPDCFGDHMVILAVYTNFNPVKNQEIILAGERIALQLSIEGLMLNKYFYCFGTTSQQRSQKVLQTVVTYDMNFGFYESGMKKKLIFYLNNETSDTFLFKFTSFIYATFSPEIGHIGPKEYVEIESILHYGILVLSPLKETGSLIYEKLTVVDNRKSIQKALQEWVPENFSCEKQQSARNENKSIHRTASESIFKHFSDTGEAENKINLNVYCCETVFSLFLSEETTIFTSTIIKECSEQTLSLKNHSQASAYITFQIVDISFKEIDIEDNTVPNLGFLKISPTILSPMIEEPQEDLKFVALSNVIYENNSIENVFSPLKNLQNLSAESSIDFKIIFCPPKPGVYSANVRFCIEEKLLDFPCGIILGVGFIPPIQIMVKSEVEPNELKLLGVSLDVKCIKLITYEPKSSFRDKLIYIYNATDKICTYKWYNKHNVSTIENSSTGFYCYHQVSGSLENLSVLKLEMVFSPQEYGIYESLWYLEIPEYEIEQGFLFIGETKIPDIMFDPDLLILEPVFAGMKAESKLKIYNKEKVKFKYTVDSITLCSDIDSEKLNIDPISSVLEPNAVNEIKVSSILHSPRKYVYRTLWNLENVAKKICATIITQCMSIEVTVTCITPCNEVVLLKQSEENIINVGRVLVNDKLNFSFVISNEGRAPIQFEWNITQEHCRKLSIEINPYDKFVPVAFDLFTALKVTIPEKTNFSDIPIILKIFKGPQYKLFLCGSSEDPLYDLSFKQYDFGACLIQTDETVHNFVNLQFINNDTQILLIELMSKHVGEFKIELTCSSVVPKSVVDIPVYFFPREKVKYRETVEILINGMITELITLIGEGEIFQIDVLKPLKRIIYIDQIGVNKSTVEETEIINLSNTTFNIDLKIKNDYPNFIIITMEPTNMCLKSNISSKILINIETTYCGDFSDIEVWAVCYEHSMKLYSVKVHCVGAKLSLDKSIINFFPNFRKDILEEEVAIINTGNIPTKFHLDITNLPEYFKIIPLDGECFPGIPYILRISYSVQYGDDYLTAKIQCFSEGNSDDYMELTLTASPIIHCIKHKTLNFMCPVRQESVLSTVINNRTKKHWRLQPVIKGDYFSGSKTLYVSPRSSQNYSVCYKPLTMTKHDSKHKGILIIPTEPVETVVQLVGSSSEPLAEECVFWSSVAKEEYIGTLEVSNPVHCMQKMSVHFKRYKSAEINYYILKGQKCVVLPCRSQKEYEVILYAYKEGTINFDVVFTNDETGEFMFYNVTVEVKPMKLSWKTVELSTCIGTPLTETIPIYNPFQVEEILHIDSVEPPLIDGTLMIIPYSLNILPQQEGYLEIAYNPENVEKRELYLKLTGHVLGTYLYKIILNCEPPAPNDIVFVSASLGSSVSFSLKLPKILRSSVSSTIPLQLAENECKAPPSYHNKKNIARSKKKKITCSQLHPQSKELFFTVVSDSDEIIVKTFHGSDENQIKCVYEPFLIGKRDALVTVKYSNPFMHHLFPIMCQCDSPKPYGPINISRTKPALITFKNVFRSVKSFSCSSPWHGEVFIVSNPSFELQSKEKIGIKISLKTDYEGTSLTGIIIIRNLPEENYKWEYYVKL